MESLKIISRDNFEYFLEMCYKLVDQIFDKMKISAKTQLLWIVGEMIEINIHARNNQRLVDLILLIFRFIPVGSLINESEHVTLNKSIYYIERIFQSINTNSARKIRMDKFTNRIPASFILQISKNDHRFLYPRRPFNFKPSD